jgi:hypothetical protein
MEIVAPFELLYIIFEATHPLSGPLILLSSLVIDVTVLVSFICVI